MKTYTAQLELGLNGNVQQQCRRFSSGFAQLETTGRRSLAALATYSNTTHNALSRIFNGTTAFVGGVGLGVSGKAVGDMQTRLTRLRLQAEVSKDRMAKLNDQIFKVSQQRDINIDASELLAAVEKIVSKTGDLDFAQENLKNLAYAISATGAAGQDVGAMAADIFEKFNIKKADEMVATLGLLVNQGKAGAFELRDLATQGERVTAAYGRTGRTGMQAVREMGAMLQMARKATGSPEQAATALEALIRSFNDPSKRKMMEDAGIQIMDPEDPKRMRSIVDISKDLIKATNGDASKIGRVIDQEGLRALTAMLIEYNQGKGFKSVESFLKASTDSQGLLDDSKEVAQNFNASVTSLKNAVNYFANTNLTPYMQRLADAINSLSPEQLQNYLEFGKKAFVGLASVWAGSKIIGLGASLFAKGGKSGAAGLIGDFASATFGKPVPVFVVNAGGASLSGYSSRFKQRPSIGGKAIETAVGGTLLKNSLRVLGRLGAAGAIGYGGYEALTADNARDMGKGIGTSVGAAIGMLGGPLGIAVGTAVGRYLGGKIGETVDNYKKADNNEDKSKVVGKSFGNAVGWLFGGKIGSDFYGKYSEAAAGYIGRLLDNFEQSKREEQKREYWKQKSMLPKTQNNIYFTIDRDGVPHLTRQDGNLEQTKFDVEVGFTRMYGNEA